MRLLKTIANIIQTIMSWPFYVIISLIALIKYVRECNRMGILIDAVGYMAYCKIIVTKNESLIRYGILSFWVAFTIIYIILKSN